ncbi:bifunctional diaminohydroxyphosphoribosylaminopyrimidine deaminase/5-amino-6-(5-phosphoribosylamino)uracil reductase RibD [Celerinatantimonas sp. YJH-8]|uniref:bifunctional diaminohydroxyphosphoribosylaminopyrimidine deaminase/5-amino-6-(5-phosphoribosylamino)uracil reductase RibD n=1 Tax=Celerinatantimonas sp. YJH-8 TaxID=3228714 RepID=UPI0038C637C4
MSEFSAQDYQFMARALQLAARGRFTTPPNPNVGCVIVQQGHIIGEGFHVRAGEGHAEVNAVRDAKSKGHSLVGARCYVTLEPCCHFGRTPPCAQLLIDEKVGSVVMAMRDPNPRVCGGGKSMLEAAGIQVASGLMAEQAEQLNRGFLMRMRQNRPYIRLKIATSLDGRTALSNGKSQWITGPLCRQDVQRERAQSHAILSTAQTVIDDQASLNVRPQEMRSLGHTIVADVRQPIRVIIDRRQRLTGHERLFELPGRIIRVTTRQPNHELGESLVVPKSEHWLQAVLTQLAQLEINDLWVEAGMNFSGALLKEQLVDELVWYHSSQLLGNSARGMAEIGCLDELSQALSWTLLEQVQIGDEFKYRYRSRLQKAS